MESIEASKYLNHIEKILRIKNNNEKNLRKEPVGINDRLEKVYLKLNDYLEYSQNVFEKFINEEAIIQNILKHNNA